MSIRLNKQWTPLNSQNISKLRAELGVYQLGNADGEVVFIGYAGGRSLFGLRGALEMESTRRGAGRLFRVEVTSQYLSRYAELLMIHKADHGVLPSENAVNECEHGLGRLSPG